MKAKSDIEGRLQHLRERYLHAHLRQAFERRPSACVHNHEHTPNVLKYKQDPFDTELELAPRRVTTLVVLDDRPKTIRLCMYGSDQPQNWPGVICDSNEKAKDCPYFKPRVSVEEATRKFNELLLDDEYVAANHPDVAALQWVLGIRIGRRWRRLFSWIRTFFFGRRLEQLPPAEEDDGLEPFPEDYWR